MSKNIRRTVRHDFKGIGYSKIGHFKEVQSKIKELEDLNIELARRHHKLEAIFNGMSDGLTILDRNLNIVYVNEVQKQFFPNTSLIGHKCFNVYYRRNNRCRKCPAQRTLETREVLQGEVFIESGEFAGRYFEWTTSPIKGPTGGVDEFILLMRDVTQRKEYEHKLRETDRMATIGFLAAGIAHEINNPLTSIAGFAEGLVKRLKKIKGSVDDPIFASFREYLEIICSEAHRCKKIIGNLQAFSESSSDAFEILKIESIIGDTLALFRQHAKDRGIKMGFENHLSQGLNTLLGKSSQLKHLFLNILNRAFQSMEKGGTILLKAGNKGNRIEIELVYNGDNVFPSHHTFRSSVSLSGDFDNVDTVNLSICYNIVQHHQGDICFGTSDTDDIVTLSFPVSLPESDVVSYEYNQTNST